MSRLLPGSLLLEDDRRPTHARCFEVDTHLWQSSGGGNKGAQSFIEDRVPQGLLLLVADLLTLVAHARNPRAYGEACDETSEVLGGARSCAIRVLVGVQPPTKSGGIWHITLTSSSRFSPQWSSPLHLTLCKCGGSPSLEKLRPVEVAEEFDQLRDDPGPARLVAGSQARAIVT